VANWYTSDLHFDHVNILGFCNRPFRDVDHMNTSIVNNIASRVEHDDDLWVLGDFAFGNDPARFRHWFDLIPGRKHLIVGNHDGRLALELPWASIHHILEIKDGNQVFVLCHYPMLTWNKARRGAIQLFGHVHNNWQGSRNSLNVGVDVWDFQPVQARDLLARAKTLPVNYYWGVVEPRVDIGDSISVAKLGR
jgi:calcineurin-like phosphoesterase family protein